MKENLDLQAREMLAEARLYRTRSRCAIVKVLLQADRPMRQEQIARQLGDEGLNKVTIYRTLESFERVGLIHRAYVQKRAGYFELARNCTASQCHPHFTCTNCGQTQCMVELRLPMVTGLREGFVLLRQQVRLEGLCPACA